MMDVRGGGGTKLIDVRGIAGRILFIVSTIAANLRVGEYVLLERLGQGTFGEVWRARHHAWEDQLVAIKIPTDPEYVRNLQKEGDAVHRLSHPNIVKAMAFDPFANPAYFAMEYVPGQSLRELIGRGPLSVESAVAVMRQVLLGLDHAHRQGRIHRDVQPENILSHESANWKGFIGGTVKLTDFGLGQAVTRSMGSIVLSQELPETKKIVGSVLYMAPEQRKGLDVDARADLYACGAVLFEMLTGQRPEGTEVPSDVNPQVPKALDDVFRRSFARLERRYGSAEEFLGALNGSSPQSVRAVVVTPPPLAYVTSAAVAAISPYLNGYATHPTQLGPGGLHHKLQEFPVAAAVVLQIITLGFFGLIYWNLMHDKLPKNRHDDPSGGKALGFCFIPFFNLYWIFFTVLRLVDRINEQRVCRGLKPVSKGLLLICCIVQVVPYFNLIIGMALWPIGWGILQSSWRRILLIEGEAGGAGRERPG